MTGIDGNRSRRNEVAGAVVAVKCLENRRSLLEGVKDVRNRRALPDCGGSRVVREQARSGSSEGEQGVPLVVAQQGNQGGNNQGGNDQGGDNDRKRTKTPTPSKTKTPTRTQTPTRTPTPTKTPRSHQDSDDAHQQVPVDRAVLPRLGRAATPESGRLEAGWGRRGGCGRGLG